MRELRANASPRRCFVALVGVASLLALAGCGATPAASSTGANLGHTAGLDGSASAAETDEPLLVDTADDTAGDTAHDTADDTAGDRSITIAFGGDIHFESFLATRLDDAPLELLDPVAELMADADLAVANLETAVTDRGSPADKAFTFRAPPAAFDALRDAGIDVVSMANNHGLDYGTEGLEDSLAHAEHAGFPLIGIGRNAAEAYAPWSAEVKGHRIAVLAATQVLDEALITRWTATDDQPGLASAKDIDALVDAVEAARATHDTVVVFLHWGIEGQRCPAARQVDLADRLIEAGADAVVGGHAHRLQGGGWNDGAFVHYGLGNFVFYTEHGPGTDSGVLLLTIRNGVVDDYEWVPARLQAGVATRLTGDDAAAALAAWDDLRPCTGLEP